MATLGKALAYQATTLDYVSLTQLAPQVGLDRSTLRKYVLKHGFNLVKIRTPDSRGQQTLALSTTDAEQVKALRQDQGFGSLGLPVADGRGVFYVVQLVPDLAPCRVKFGYATDMDARLGAHRTAAPTAVTVRTWPCRKHWEYTAIDALTRVGCRCIGSEVYEVDSIEAALARGDAFFGLLPLA